MNAVKERPILFSTPMVREILEGRKTVTRRAINIQPHIDASGNFCVGRFNYGQDGYGKPVTKHFVSRCCPYGRPGDRLWVRETWGVISHDFDEIGNMVEWVPDRPAQPIRDMPFGRGYYTGHVIYRADGDAEWAGDDDGGGDTRSAWKPSIHMPRIASRILLEITDVRVERLQDISDEQCVDEGTGLTKHAAGVKLTVPQGKSLPKAMFEDLWSSINGAESWDANPWVWVVEFKPSEELPSRAAEV